MNKFIDTALINKSVFVLINHTTIEQHSRGEYVFVWNLDNFPDLLAGHLDHSIRKISILNFVEDVLLEAEDNEINISVNDSISGEHCVVDPVALRQQMLTALAQSIKISSISDGAFSPNSKIMSFLEDLKLNQKLFILLMDDVFYSEKSSLQEDAYVMPVWSTPELAESYLSNHVRGAKVVGLEMEHFVANTLPLLMESLMLVGFNWDSHGTGPEKYSEDIFEFFCFMEKQKQ